MAEVAWIDVIPTADAPGAKFDPGVDFELMPEPVEGAPGTPGVGARPPLLWASAAGASMRSSAIVEASDRTIPMTTSRVQRMARAMSRT
jgi:hypothetical protein